MIDINDIICPGFSSYTDSKLTVNLQRIDDIILASLDGFIDTYNSKFFITQVEKLINISKKIIIDFSKIDYISSSGIGALSEINKKCNLVIIGVQSKIRDVLQLLGFDQLFEITYSIDTAIKIINSQKQSVFPKIIICPQCKSKVKIIKSGKFRCPKCKSIILVDTKGNVIEK